MYENLPGVTGISDDVLVAGSTKKGHLEMLRATFQRAHESGQRYNLSKCRFNVEQGRVNTRYTANADSTYPKWRTMAMSYRLTVLRWPPRKVEAIVNMAAPTNKTELQTILGMTPGEVCPEPQQRHCTDA